MKFYFVSGKLGTDQLSRNSDLPLTELKFVNNMISENSVCQKYSQWITDFWHIKFGFRKQNIKYKLNNIRITNRSEFFSCKI